MAASFDHLIGADEQRGRHGEAERLGGLEIDARSKADPAVGRGETVAKADGEWRDLC